MARLFVVWSVAAALIAGCGGGTRPGPRPGPPKQPIPTTAGAITIPAPPPTGVAPDPASVTVIRAWADALRRGDVKGAARYFALPSVMINSAGSNGNVSVIHIFTAAEAAQANASLPCGARFISADVRGRYVNALFRLTGRPGLGGSNCGGGGATARTNFIIAGGRIVEWIRAPDDPGDNSGPQTGPPPNQGPVA
jgi:hypothetical protein